MQLRMLLVRGSALIYRPAPPGLSLDTPSIPSPDLGDVAALARSCLRRCAQYNVVASALSHRAIVGPCVWLTVRATLEGALIGRAAEVRARAALQSRRAWLQQRLQAAEAVEAATREAEAAAGRRWLRWAAAATESGAVEAVPRAMPGTANVSPLARKQWRADAAARAQCLTMLRRSADAVLEGVTDVPDAAFPVGTRVVLCPRNARAEPAAGAGAAAALVAAPAARRAQPLPHRGCRRCREGVVVRAQEVASVQCGVGTRLWVALARGEVLRVDPCMRAFLRHVPPAVDVWVPDEMARLLAAAHTAAAQTAAAADGAAADGAAGDEGESGCGSDWQRHLVPALLTRLRLAAAVLPAARELAVTHARSANCALALCDADWLVDTVMARTRRTEQGRDVELAASAAPDRADDIIVTSDGAQPLRVPAHVAARSVLLFLPRTARARAADLHEVGCDAHLPLALRCSRALLAPPRSHSTDRSCAAYFSASPSLPPLHPPRAV